VRRKEIFNMALNVVKLRQFLSWPIKSRPNLCLSTHLPGTSPNWQQGTRWRYGDVQLRQWLFIWHFVDCHLDVSSDSSMVDDSGVCDWLAIVVLLKPGSEGFQ
jgi:hypothetical protein